MKIFITGGTGFIGRFVVRKLQQERHHLLIYTREKRISSTLLEFSKNTQIVHGSLSNLNNLKKVLLKFKPDVAIHLAWEGIPDFSPKISSKNLIQSLKLVTLLAEVKCKTFISTGSCWEYEKKKGKVRENMLSATFTPFTAAKYALYILGTEIAKEKGMNFVWARLFFVYGPGQKEGSLIPFVTQSLKNGQIPKIKNPNGANDFVYVEDVADALVLFAKKGKILSSGVYNVGSGRLTTVQDILKYSMKIFGINHSLKKSGRSEGFYADISKTKKETGWSSTTNIVEGIKKTILHL